VKDSPVDAEDVVGRNTLLTNSYEVWMIFGNLSESICFTGPHEA